MTMAFASPSALNTKGSVASSISHRSNMSRIRAVPPRPACVRMVSVPETISNPNPNSVTTSAPATTDVVVIGAGPAGLSLARALGERGVRVVCVDPALDKAWPNNYGTWEDELIPLELEDCVSNTWKKTAVYMENTAPKTVLSRTYVRVDRKKLKRRLLEKCEASGNVRVIHAKATEVDTATSKDISTVRLDTTEAFNSRVVIDATGHSLRFTKLMDTPYSEKPGYQAAYGIEAEIKGELTAFSPDEMVLMDFRDNHMQMDDSETRDISEKEPTFLYVMPLGGNRVFFEETSLVANPAMDFGVLKRRLYKRLAHHGVEIARVDEEEFCLIPMGGSLPDASQRIVAYGGAAAFVHPATGYMIARALTLANTTADGIAAALNVPNSSAESISQTVWAKTWNATMLSQRDFLNYGGSYLQKIGLQETRDFFRAFFKLPIEQWGGFLSFKLEQPLERLEFGLGVFYHTTNRVRSHLVFDSLTNGGMPFFLSLLPLSWTQPKMPTSKKE